jgi:arabinogalactan oligomer/maltooligosaccharide transport system permease protein
MSTTTTTAPTPVKVERMSLGRWVKTVGWRHLILVIAVVFALFPIGYILNLAFAGGNTLTSACPLDYQGLQAVTCLVPQPWTWNTSNFTEVLKSEQLPFPVWFRNTMIIATVVSFVSVFMGASAAFAFSRMRFTGRRPGLLALVLVQMFPQILALTAIFLLLSQIRDVFPQLGLNSIYGLILVYLGGTLGVNTYLMKGFFDTIPVEIDESARIDGASHVRIFFGMILRLAAPILTVVFFVTFTGMFNELAIASVILPNQQDTTLAVGLNAYVASPITQYWGFFAAGAVMAAVPMLIVFAFAQKQLVTGLTAGSVKG